VKNAGTNSDTIEIRAAASEELFAVAALVAAQLTEQGGSSVPDAETILKAMTDEGQARQFPRECFVAVDTAAGGAILGCAVIAPVFGLPGNALGLRHLFVLPESRRRSIGRRLMAAIARRAAELGCTRIEWQVPRLDLDPRAFFEIVAPDSFRLNDLNYCVEADGIDAVARDA